MNIGLRIKQRRKELRMTADELGKLIGKDRSTIYRYEKGDIETMPLEILEPVAQFLQTTPQHLMGWDVQEKKKPTDDDRLSENVKQLVDFAKTVPDDKVDLVLKIMKSIVEDA